MNSPKLTALGGAGIGVAIGVSLGVALGSLSAGVAMAAGLGVLWALVFCRAAAKRNTSQ